MCLVIHTYPPPLRDSSGKRILGIFFCFCFLICQVFSRAYTRRPDILINIESLFAFWLVYLDSRQDVSTGIDLGYHKANLLIL